MLLHSSLTRQELNWFQERGILTKEVTPLYDKPMGKYSGIVTSKLHVFDFDMKRWEHVILLDADIIVRKSLSSLSAVDTFSAVAANGDAKLWDEFDSPKSPVEWWNYRVLRKKYNLEEPAFNSGVIAFSTSIIQDATITELTALLTQFGSLSRFAEQGILNLYFEKKWKPLSSAFNTFPEYARKELQLPYTRLEASVLHFADQGEENKPWNPHNFFYEEWAENLKSADLIHF